MKKNILFIITTLLLVSCAQIKNPTGGTKDSAPPLIEKSIPENQTTNFNKNEKIIITFNEFIKLNKLNEQLLISPPIQPNPTITTKGKRLYIDLTQCALQDEVTYSINLGDALVDHNEGNAYNNLTYVFSTGNTIDSAEVKGTLWNIKKGEKPANVSVFLYNNTTDTFYNTKPSYLVKTDSNGMYNFKNLPNKQFSLLALEDKNKNKVVDYEELVGFSNNLINLSTGNVVLENINIFSYLIKPNIIIKDTISTPTNTKYLFNKDLKDVPVSLKNKNKTYTVYKIDKDTLIIYPNSQKESITILLNNKKLSQCNFDSVTSINKNNTFNFLNKNNLHENDTLFIQFNKPKEQINKNQINLIDTNGHVLPFSIHKVNPFKFGFYSEFIENKQYKLILNKSITRPDSADQIKDTFNLTIIPNKVLGNLFCNIPNYSDSINPKIIVLYSNNQIVKSKKITNNIIRFNYLMPGIYTLKLIEDSDNNGKWTTGLLEKRVQPELIIHYNNPIDIKANWDLEVNINL